MQLTPVCSPNLNQNNSPIQNRTPAGLKALISNHLAQRAEAVTTIMLALPSLPPLLTLELGCLTGIPCSNHTPERDAL